MTFENDKEIEKKIFTTENSKTPDVIYSKSYFPNGKLQKRSTYNPKEKNLYWIEYEYDSQGNEISENTYKNKNLTGKYSKKIEYY